MESHLFICRGIDAGILFLVVHFRVLSSNPPSFEYILPKQTGLDEFSTFMLSSSLSVSQIREMQLGGLGYLSLTV